MNGNKLTHRIAELLLLHPRSLIALVLIILAVSFIALPHLRRETGVDVFINPKLPLRKTLTAVNDHFVNDDLLYVGYEVKDPFSHRSLTAVRDLVSRLEALELTNTVTEPTFVAEDVKALTNLKDLVGSEMNYHTVDLVPEPIPTEPAALAHIKARAIRNPIIFDNLLAQDLSAAALLVRIPDEFDDYQRAEAIAEIRSVLRAVERENDWIQFYMAGESAIKADLSAMVNRDMGKFIPLAFAIVLLLMAVFVRRPFGIVLALLMSVVSLIAGLALLPLTGGTLNNCTGMLPPLLITLTAAIFLHYISELGKNAYHGDVKHSALHTLEELLSPAFIAALTTAIGFASLSFAEVPAVSQFGIAASASIMVAFVVVTMLFAFFARWRQPPSLISERSIAYSQVLHGLLDRLSSFVVRSRWIILTVSVLVTGFTAFGISLIEVDTEFIPRFPKSSPIRRSTEFVDDRLIGSSNVIVAIFHQDEGHFEKPEVLAKMEALKQYMREVVDIPHVTSAVDYLKIMNREYFNGDEAHYRIPDSEEQVAQLVLLNGDASFEEYMDQTRRAVRVVGHCHTASSAEVIDKYKHLDSYLATMFPKAEGYKTRTTGMAKLTAYATVYIVKSAGLGLAITCTLVMLLMFIMFRSIRVGLVAMVPNVIPVVGIMGTMGWMGVALDSATVLIATVSLGIAVDDTVHFVHHMRERVTAHGDFERAIRETNFAKGPAIIWTSIAICLGFCVMLTSELSNARSFGILMSSAMLIALVSDLFVLPGIILTFGAKIGAGVAKDTTGTNSAG